MLTAEEWQAMFENKFVKDPYIPQPIAMMEVIQESLYLDDSTTLQELIERMKMVRRAICSSKSAAVSLRSAGELFTLFITRAPTAIEMAESIGEVRDILISRGEDFLETYSGVGPTLGKIAVSHLIEYHHNNGAVITHSWNQCVLHTCIEGKRQGFISSVIVTEGQPLNHGGHMVEKLKEAGVPALLVPDSAMAFYMEQCKMTLVGAEIACPNGGIIARIGTASLAAVSQVFRRNVYGLVETYRFSSYHQPINNNTLKPQDVYGPLVKVKHPGLPPTVDYTPAEHIRCIYTDVGPLHPCIIQETINKMFT